MPKVPCLNYEWDARARECMLNRLLARIQVVEEIGVDDDFHIPSPSSPLRDPQAHWKRPRELDTYGTTEQRHRAAL